MWVKYQNWRNLDFEKKKKKKKKKTNAVLPITDKISYFLGRTKNKNHYRWNWFVSNSYFHFSDVLNLICKEWGQDQSYLNIWSFEYLNIWQNPPEGEVRANVGPVFGDESFERRGGDREAPVFSCMNIQSWW